MWSVLEGNLRSPDTVPRARLKRRWLVLPTAVDAPYPSPNQWPPRTAGAQGESRAEGRDNARA